MTHSTPDPDPDTGPVETKVTAATTAAVLSSLVVWALDEYAFPADTVPGVVEAAVVLLVTGAVTFLAGYMAKHTRRPDLPAAER